MPINEIKNLIYIKENLEEQLSRLTYGSIEIREMGNNKYIYVHYRENNKSYCKYVDEYSDELYKEIKDNNVIASNIRKNLKAVKLKLKESNYLEEELSKKVKLNIDFIRKNLIDVIYKQSILEGISTTEAQTEKIIEGKIVNGVTSTDIMKILNLKNAWNFLLDKDVILSPTDFSLLSYLNKLVIENFYYNAGLLRTTPVKIGGTNWTPDFPVEAKIKEELNKIINKKLSNIDKAIEILLYVMKQQIFIDGNKRTAVIFANHYLIKRGLGLIVIPAELTDKYKELLISYYEGKDKNKIKEFLKDFCYIKMY